MDSHGSGGFQARVSGISGTSYRGIRMTRWLIRHRKAGGEWRDLVTRWHSREQVVSSALNMCACGDADEADVVNTDAGAVTDRWRQVPGRARRFVRERLVPEGD